MTRRAFGGIRKLPSKKHQAYYTGPDGLRHAAHSTFVRRGDAEAWLSDEERLVDEGRWTPPAARNPNHRQRATLTLDEYAAMVIRRRESRARKPLKPSTASGYRQLVRVTISGELGGLPLTAITAGHIQRWHDGLSGTPTQAGNAYGFLASVMADAVHEKLVDESPCQIRGAGKPAPKRTPRIITPDVVAAYLAAAEDPYRTPLGLLIWCSQRSGEVRALRRSDIANDATRLRIERGVTRVSDETPTGRGRARWHFDTPKSKAGERTVAVPPVIQADLLECIRQHDESGRGPDALLFAARNGIDPLHDNTLRKAHKRALARIGMSGVTLHDLRRTGATMAGRSGATTKELMRRLGHARPDVAMLYQVADDERDRAVADAMAALVSPATPPSADQ